MNNSATKKAILYRMVMEHHVCPYGLKAKDLLRRKSYEIEDNWLTNREQVDEFKNKYNVNTTPQIFINDERIGGYDDLRRYFGKKTGDSKEKSYRPVIALFTITALMAIAVSYASFDNSFTLHTLGWFIAFSMSVLALLKLQNIERFSTMFLNYDLLAKR